MIEYIVAQIPTTNLETRRDLLAQGKIISFPVTPIGFWYACFQSDAVKKIYQANR